MVRGYNINSILRKVPLKRGPRKKDEPRYSLTRSYKERPYNIKRRCIKY